MLKQLQTKDHSQGGNLLRKNIILNQYKADIVQNL